MPARSVHPSDQRIADLKGRDAAQRRLQRIAKLMDSQVRLPVLGVRIGADAIIGLMPGVGDVITGAIGAYLIYEAQKLGIPRSAVVRMVANIAIDTAIGAIPFAGDVWDFFFRANDRNMQILARHIGGLPIDVAYEDTATRRR